MPLSLLDFVRKWNASTRTEESGAKDHFRDLCEALDVPHPTQSDEIGTSYTYEKRVTKAGGGIGFADVWKRGFFAWEYKSKGGNLNHAYRQLNEYHEALDNPPLLIVCDFIRFEVHTKFENQPSRVFAFTLDDLLRPTDTATSGIPPLQVLRHVFGDFNQLRPGIVAELVTRAAAADFLRLARQLELEKAAAPPLSSTPPASRQQIAHFLMRLVFCLFADSVGLLPSHAFRSLVTNQRFSPINFNRILPTLFAAMSNHGSFFGADTIPYFNGGLFSDDSTIPLNQANLGILYAAAQHDWSHIEPVIFGTLFERSLDADKRSMIGAHYTSEQDIMLLIEPVILVPLKRRWETVKQSILEALAAEAEPQAIAPVILSERSGSQDPNAAQSLSPATSARNFQPQRAALPHSATHTLSAESAPLYQPGATPRETRAKSPKGRKARPILPPAKSPQPTLKLNRPAFQLLEAWAAELSHVRILDPACGSGNFLYIALKRLLDLWHEARLFGNQHGLTLGLDPIPHPGQLFGIEIDFYAHEIASIVVWIGFLQWKHDHGIKEINSPVLEKLENIQHADAILRYSPEGKPFEPQWPPTEYIVGNPPFLGGKLLRRELGDTYVDDLFELYRGRVKAESDLVVYWFEKARAQLESSQISRVGLLATQGIRGGANRNVLDRIEQSASIFWAWSDRNWLLNGAAVHVSMVAFDNGNETMRTLNGEQVTEIHSDLRNGANLTSSRRLRENEQICFMGTTKVGAFDIGIHVARKMLAAPLNPNGRSNADVLRPWLNATDITRRPRGMYIIDFGTSMSEPDAALYELPFEYLKRHVLSKRVGNKRAAYADRWWIHGEPRPDLRSALTGLPRFIATARVSKHRLFTWLPANTLPDSATFAFARDDDYFFGVLHSSVHELWARRQGTQLREVESGFRYTPKSTFDTFPFPWPPNQEPKDSPLVAAIASAARTLVELRDRWLNPPDIPASDLKKRTLTNLYNQRPTWLVNAHRTLDRAVSAAYGWPPDLPTSEILARLLALNHQRAAANPPPTHP